MKSVEMRIVILMGEEGRREAKRRVERPILILQINLRYLWKKWAKE